MRKNQVNTKIAIATIIFLVVYFSSKEISYSFFYSIGYLLSVIEPLNKKILKYINLIEPTLYYGIKKELPTIMSAYSRIEKLYNLLGIAILTILGGLIIYFHKELLNSIYLGEININIREYFINWLLLALLLLLVRYFINIFRIFTKIVFNWTFLCSIILLYIFFRVNNINLSTSIVNAYSVLVVILFFLIVILKLNSNNKFDKFSYYNLWFKESCGQWGRYRKYLENQDQERSENISILSDDPIRYKNDDLFGYKNIADNVYKLICGIDPKDGAYSIGIIGEWGLGKSSIIGILEESNLNLDSNIITYKFNPWNYNKNDLVERFITDISGKINIRSISKELSKYMESLSSINSTTGVIHKLYNIFQKNEGLDDIRSNISEKLKALGKKFVIIIDDLDRCEPDEVILMLNIIKNIGNFNNIIYVISFDKIHLIESLKSKGFNKDYIEKIINSEIHLPIPSKEKKAIYFKEKFYEILTSVSISESIIHESCRLVTESGNMGLDEIFENNNLRFIKKLLNSLNVNFKLRFNEDKDKIRNLHQIDIANIILINYIKIKDISFYNDSIFKKTLNERTLKYKSPNKPVLYNDLNEKKIHERFLNLILGMRVGLIDNGDSLYIENTFFSSDPQIKERINHNWELLNEYS